MSKKCLCYIDKMGKVCYNVRSTLTKKKTKNTHAETAKRLFAESINERKEEYEHNRLQTPHKLY